MSSAQILSRQPTRRSHNQTKIWINCPRLSINISVTFVLNPSVLFRLNTSTSWAKTRNLLFSADVNVGYYLCCKALNWHEKFLAKNLYFNPWIEKSGGGVSDLGLMETFDFLRFESENSPEPGIITSRGQRLLFRFESKNSLSNLEHLTGNMDNMGVLRPPCLSKGYLSKYAVYFDWSFSNWGTRTTKEIICIRRSFLL